MGWVGIGALIASISFVLYRYPPSFWIFVPWWHRAASPPPGDNDIAAPRPSEHLPATDEPEDGGTSQSRNTEKQAESDSQHVSPESTPRATPLSPPGPEIPSFNLDGVPDADTSSDGSSPAPSVRAIEQQFTSTTPTPQPGPARSSTPNPPPGSMGPPPQRVLPKPRPSNLMPPPPRPSNMSSLRPPPSAAATLRAPSTSTLSPPVSVPGQPARPSRKVVLQPGHSPLDWAALTSNPRSNLRGNVPPTLIRVTPSMLKMHNGRKGRDAWTSYRGKVYNITPYIPFHPGGKAEIMRGAGRDSEKLFMEIHPWVNWDGMLGECLVGILVAENDSGAQKGELDEMD
ncbi:hypothetical protein VTO42DRAFT_7656 [Malbranchea cinnamomea]